MQAGLSGVTFVMLIRDVDQPIAIADLLVMSKTKYYRPFKCGRT